MSGYLSRLLAAYQSGEFQPGEVTLVEVVHTPQCPAIRGGACSCEPDLTVQTLPPAEAGKCAGPSGKHGVTNDQPISK